MSKLDVIKRKIKKSELVVGVTATLNDVCVTELLGNIGFDFIMVDSEHTALDKQEIQHHIITGRSTNAAIFIRIPWNDPVLVKPILDMGPSGIVFPFIKTADDARLAVSSATYPPKGIRGFGPRGASKYGLVDAKKYINNSDSQIWKIMQIEHVDAVNNLDEILQVEGVDCIAVGPNDLSGSIGLLGQTDHEDVKKLMDIIAEKTLKSGIPFGAFVGMNFKANKEWMERGASWVLAGNDMGFISKTAKDNLMKTNDLFANIRNT